MARIMKKHLREGNLTFARQSSTTEFLAKQNLGLVVYILRLMKARILALTCFALSLIATIYLSWALHRVSGEVMMSDTQWPRSWPYPDEWLLVWQSDLDVAHPVQPGYIKLHGELPRLRLYLWSWTFVASIAMAAGLCWRIWSSKRHELKPLSHTSASG